MISLDQDTSTGITRKGFLLAVLLGLALVLIGRLIFPSVGLLSLAGAGLILVIYGLAGYFGFPRVRPEILKLASILGLLAGIIFAGEILLEYAILPKDNTSWGIIEFASVFVIYFLSSLVVAYHHKNLRAGILAAVVSSMLSSVIWLIFALLTFYLFRDTARQESVFMAEGNYADFARSGMSDFNTFVMEDFLGAGFFHLLLTPIIAIILGAIGGLLGKGLAQFLKKSESSSINTR
jgi:hypothetical protein